MRTYLEGCLPIWQEKMCWLHVKICRECADFVANHLPSFSKGRSVFGHPYAAVPRLVPIELVKVVLARQSTATARNARYF